MTKKIWNVLGLGGIVTISTTLILLSFSGCQTSQKEKVEKQILSKEREVVLAAELRKTIDKQFGIIRNDEAKKFLDGVLGRILSANPTFGTPDKFKIHFLNSTNKIFISGLNGDLFISTHAIRGVTYENELAYLLAFAVMTSVRDLAVKKVIAEEGEEIGNSLLTLPTTPPAKHNLFSGELFKKGGFFDYGVETYVSIAKLAVGVLHNTNYDVRGALTAMSVPKIFLTEFFVGPETVQPDVKVEIARLSPTRDVILKTKEFDRFAAKFKRTFVRAKKKP